jgi:hypothetical protein
VFRVGVKNHLGPYNEAKCRVHIKYNMNYWLLKQMGQTIIKRSLTG